MDLKTIKELDPAQMRARQIAKEEAERFDKIADEIIKILVKNSITMDEVPRVITTFSTKIDGKLKEAKIENILELNNGKE